MAAIWLTLLIISIISTQLVFGERPVGFRTKITCTPNELVLIQCPQEIENATGNISTSDGQQWWFINSQDDLYVVTINGSSEEKVMNCTEELNGATVQCDTSTTSKSSTFALTTITALIVGSGLIILAMVAIILILCIKKFCCCRSPIIDDGFAQRHKARESQENIERGKVMNIVKQYLSKFKQYTGLTKLDDLGCRLQKFWFQITSSNGEILLLTIAPVSRNCALQLNHRTIDTLDEMLKDMMERSPMYINTVHKIDYISLEQGNGYVIIIQDWWTKGSLRDVIHKLDPREDWVKLEDCGDRLPLDQIARYGWQILEALLFYIEEGFPPLFHVHSGNIYINASDDTVRVGGYENTLLGYRTRLYRTFHDEDSKMTNWKLIDVFLFGHVIYEMATGRSLQCAIPTDEECSMGDEAVAEILKYIFHFNKPRYFWQRSISAKDAFKKIQMHKFFKVKVTASKRPMMQSKKKHITELLQLVERGIPVVQQTYESSEQVDPESADTPQDAVAQQRRSIRWSINCRSNS